MNEIIEQLQKNKAVFHDILKKENESMVLWKQTPEKWCLLEIVCHLIDEECFDFRFRTKWCLEHPNEMPPPIDPVGWVTKNDYIHQDYDTKFAKFLTERDNSIGWLQSLKNVNWSSAFEHPKLGVMTARHFLANWLAHDYLHIKQITRLKYDYLAHNSGEHLDYAGIWK